MSALATGLGSGRDVSPRHEQTNRGDNDDASTSEPANTEPATGELIRWFEDLCSGDSEEVGGKNASLGEMVAELRSSGIRMPGGFATTARAHWGFLDANDLRSEIAARIDDLDQGTDLAEVGEAIRSMILDAEFPPQLNEAITQASGGHQKEGDLAEVVEGDPTLFDSIADADGTLGISRFRRNLGVIGVVRSPAAQMPLTVI
jgi:hypothetical protein